MKTKISFLLTIAILATYICGCGNNLGKTIKVGVRSDVLNFGFYNEASNNYAGLEVDIAEELAARMGNMRVEFVPVTAEDREEKINQGEVDFVVGCYAYSEQRAEKYILSKPYYTSSFAIIFEHSSMFKTYDDFEGCVFGIIDSDAVEEQLHKILNEYGVKNYKVLRFSSYDEIDRELNAGEIDAAALDSVFTYKYYDEKKEILVFDDVDTQFCVLISEKSGISKEMLDRALTDMEADGTLSDLTARWCTGGFDYE